MSQLKIQLSEGYLNYYAASPLQGTASWELSEKPTSAEIRLFWYTEGKGDIDAETVAIVPFENPQMQDQREFSFQMPAGPYSFSGKLISLIWALELVIQPHDLVERQKIVMSSTGYEIALNETKT